MYSLFNPLSTTSMNFLFRFTTEYMTGLGNAMGEFNNSKLLTAILYHQWNETLKYILRDVKLR